MQTHPRRLAALAAAALAVVALGFDDATQAIEADGLTFQVPASWKKARPTNAMRKAQLSVEAPGGGPAELVVFAFPERAGTVEQNIERYQRQFKDKDGNPPKAETRNVEGKDTGVTRVALAGTYTDPFSKAGPQEDYRMLAAIVETKGAAYFVRLVGPAKTVDKAEPAFDRMIKTIAVGGK